MRRSASKSPAWDAAMKASTISRWRASGTSEDVGPAPRTRRRARLASWRVAVGVRSTIGAISSNGRPNVSWRTNASRSAGGSRSRTMSIARPIESASTVRCSGSPMADAEPPWMLEMIGSGIWTPTRSSRRVERARSRSRLRRATIVVSQPPRFSTAALSARLARSQASWTVSSASDSEPSMRYATDRRCGRWSSNLSGQPVRVGHPVTFSSEGPSTE